LSEEGGAAGSQKRLLAEEPPWCGKLRGMGVVIPLGFGLATLPFRNTLDPEEMVCTIGFQDDPTASPNTMAVRVFGPLTSQNFMQASSGSVNYSYGPGRVTIMRTLGPVEGVDTVSRTFTNAGLLALPNNCAILAQKRTARGGRRGRGRMFFPPFFIGEGSVTSAGGVTTSLIDQWNLELENWRAGAATNVAPLYLLHDAPEIGPPIPPDAVTSLVGQYQIATQRKRMRR